MQFPSSSTEEEGNGEKASTKSSDALDQSSGSTLSASGGDKGKGKGKGKRGSVAAGNREKELDESCHDSPWHALGEPQRRQ